MSTTYTAIATGNWSASTTWSSGNVPNPATLGSTDSVVIGNFIVTYDPNGGALVWTLGTLNINGTTGGGLTANSVAMSGGAITIGAKSTITWGAFNLTGGLITDNRPSTAGMSGFGAITTSGNWGWSLAPSATVILPSWVNNGGTGTFLGSGSVGGISGTWSGLTVGAPMGMTFSGNTTFNCGIGTNPGGWSFASPNIGITIAAGVTFTCGYSVAANAGGGNFLANYGTLTLTGSFSASTANFKVNNFGTLTVGSSSGVGTFNMPIDNYKTLKLYLGSPITTGVNSKWRMMRREATLTDTSGNAMADSSSMSGFARYRIGA
jgi:hypothetical protein